MSQTFNANVEIQASDRNYISDAHGSWRVLNYQQNGVDNSDIYVPHPAIAQLDREKLLKEAFEAVQLAAEEKASKAE